MTGFLIRTFIKHPDDVSDRKTRLQYSSLAGNVGIAANLMLFVTKLIVGLVTASVAITADSFNNLSDAASSIISVVGARLASQPADREHPFGHGRIEYLSALTVAVLIISVGWSLFTQSVGKIRVPGELSFSYVAAAILVLSILVKVYLAYFNRTIGRKIESKVLLATSRDAASDVLVTSVTVAALIFYRITGINIDGWAGLLVSVFVMYTGLSVALDSTRPLIGDTEDPALAREITDSVESYAGIMTTHDLIIHNYGPGNFFVTIHAEMPNTLSFQEAHSIVDQAEREISTAMNIGLVIHADPVDLPSEQMERIRGQLETVLQSVEPKLRYHGLYLVPGKKHINLVFDVVMPFGMNGKHQEETIRRIKEEMTKLDRRYHCHITCDHAYIGEEDTEDKA